jgi:hypothetical protein
LRHLLGDPGGLQRMRLAGGARPFDGLDRLPATLPTGVTQERTAWPSTRTVQAPQAATPQPYLVPVMASRSRSTHSSGMAGSASTCPAAAVDVQFHGTLLVHPVDPTIAKPTVSGECPCCAVAAVITSNAFPRDSMALITLADAQLAFGHVALLDHADFSLQSGERVGLIGRNGAGKSSLLKILAGMEAADDGTLQRQQGLRIAFVAQEPHAAKTHRVRIGREGLADVIALRRRYTHGEGDLDALQGLIEARTAGTGSSASTRRCTACTWTRSAHRARSPAATASAWRWRRRWCAGPTCCCWTSPPTTWTWTRSSGWKTC